MQRPIFVTSTASTTTKSLSVTLQLSLHHSADGHNVATNAGVDQIVFNFTVNRLGHLTRVDVFDIVFNFLKSHSLEEASLCGVLLWVEDPGAAVHRDASIRCLPLAIYECQVDMRLAVMALELNRLNKHLDRAHSEHRAPQANELVDQMTLDLGQRVELVEVEEADNDVTLVLVLPQHV